MDRHCEECGVVVGLCVGTGGVLACDKVVDKCIPCVVESNQLIATGQYDLVIRNLLKVLFGILGGAGIAVLVKKITELLKK